MLDKYKSTKLQKFKKFKIAKNYFGTNLPLKTLNIFLRGHKIYKVNSRKSLTEISKYTNFSNSPPAMHLKFAHKVATFYFFESILWKSCPFSFIWNCDAYLASHLTYRYLNTSNNILNLFLNVFYTSTSCERCVFTFATAQSNHKQSKLFKIMKCVVYCLLWLVWGQKLLKEILRVVSLFRAKVCWVCIQFIAYNILFYFYLDAPAIRKSCFPSTFFGFIFCQRTIKWVWKENL